MNEGDVVYILQDFLIIETKIISIMIENNEKVYYVRNGKGKTFKLSQLLQTKGEAKRALVNLARYQMKSNLKITQELNASNDRLERIINNAEDDS